MQNKIESTTDYDVFKLLKSNREINKQHVDSLVESIKASNLLHLKPINVTQNFEVIDGQHRLAAAKILGVPVFYQSDPNISGVDMSILNTNTKNWLLKDYLNFWYCEGLQPYITLTKFINHHPKVPLTSAIQLCNDRRGGGGLNDFKAGRFTIANLKHAELIAGDLVKLEPYGKFVYKTSFINAMIYAYDVNGFSIDKLLNQISNQPLSFVRCVDLKQYLQMIERLYNYNVKEANRLKFTK